MSDSTKSGLGIAAAVIGVLLVLLYTIGALDEPLSSVGLNKGTCAENAFGNKMCGDELKEFCKESYNPELNADTCDEVLSASERKDAAARAEKDDPLAEPEPPPTPKGQSCDEKGINAQEGNEGTCIEEGKRITAVNKDSTLSLKELDAVLVGIEQTKTLGGESANGTYALFTLKVTNKASEPKDLGSLGEQPILSVNGKTYTRDTEAEIGLDGPFGITESEVQPDETVTGQVVFDLPPPASSQLETPKGAGNLALFNFSDEDPETAKSAGVIRLYQ